MSIRLDTVDRAIAELTDLLRDARAIAAVEDELACLRVLADAYRHRGTSPVPVSSSTTSPKPPPGARTG